MYIHTDRDRAIDKTLARQDAEQSCPHPFQTLERLPAAVASGSCTAGSFHQAPGRLHPPTKVQGLGFRVWQLHKS